ncbi:hypothetical protein BVC80_1651g130 [Macleaya cordata]|uniref:Uncharacterized protein n=1 Tax=Macleaya cordata TaxID=56857 RepID=A0A200PZH8_MACCD|nr:hypothetical protein BVC80_1651g130 [Macleaya cordata]
MEDSTMMTIEFLRARLLSERSVSRTAKQRADELVERVVELEEQLKNVTLQRKKAEETTAEVLAILENNGISDCSEAFDSSSDEEQVLQESRQDNNSNKEEEASVISRPRGTEMEELSGSEIEGSPLPGRSLSWKSCSDNPNSAEKKNINQARRRQSRFVSTSGSSGKPRLGKSCRQIKRRDMRSAVDEVENESLPLDAQENGVATVAGEASCQFENIPDNSKECSENKEDKVFLEGLVLDSLEDKRKETCAGLYANGNQSDADMEDAIEKQAQLIGRYEAEEIAQREWEEKFREDGSCTPDSCEHGNQSDITEERDEIRGTAEPSDIIPSPGAEAKSEAEAASLSRDATRKYVPNGFMPATRLDMGCSQNGQRSSMQVNNSLTGFPEFSFPHKKENPSSLAKGKQKQEWSGTSSSEHQSMQKFSSFHAVGGLHKGGTSRSVQKLQEAMQHETLNDLGCVLEELQRAKLSLKHELGGLPSSTQAWPMVRSTGTSPLPAVNTGNAMGIPVGCAGLFRIPTDPQLGATIPQTGFLDVCSDSRLSLKKNYPDLGISNQCPASPNLEIGLRNLTPKPSIDLFMDMGMTPPCSRRFTYPSFSDLVPRIPSAGKFIGPYPTINRIQIRPHS